MQTTYQPKALTPSELQALSQDVKQALTELYGDRLDQIILYGSYARGDFRPDSDVDFMLVLKDEEVKSGQEVRRMASIIGHLALTYDVEISVFPTSQRTYQSGHSFLYKEVQREGIYT